MRRRWRLASALVACGVAACAAGAADAGAAGPAITAKPGLKPDFRTDISDYTVRCRADKPVRLSVAAPSGTRVAVGSAAPRGGHFESSVALAPGRAVRLRVTSGSSARTFTARCLPGDFPKWTVSRSGTPQASFYVLTPNDNRTLPAYAAIFDSRGVPLWWMRRDLTPFNASLLPDGNLVWTRLGVHNPSSDRFEEFALDGRLVRSYTTVGSLTNEHELKALPNGDVLLVAYPPRDGVDLSRWDGPSDALVLDGEIQEVDPQGRLVWDWSTNGHLAIAEAGHWLDPLIHDPAPIRIDGKLAYDIVHLNSVEPVAGGFVFSARYEDAVYEIDRASGKVVWKLGGTHTSKSLRVSGDRLAPKVLAGAHDARVLDGGRLLTVYDNGFHADRPPRVVAFRIDRKARTAKLVRQIKFKPASQSDCCGSARLLPGGDWVVAWGHTPYVTEQTGSGKAVLTIKFGNPQVMSYRAEPILPGRLSRSALRRGMDAMAGG